MAATWKMPGSHGSERNIHSVWILIDVSITSILVSPGIKHSEIQLSCWEQMLYNHLGIAHMYLPTLPLKGWIYPSMYSCVHFDSICPNFYAASNLRDLFHSIHPKRIIPFIPVVGLTNKLSSFMHDIAAICVLKMPSNPNHPSIRVTSHLSCRHYNSRHNSRLFVVDCCCLTTENKEWDDGQWNDLWSSRQSIRCVFITCTASWWHAIRLHHVQG